MKVFILKFDEGKAVIGVYRTYAAAMRALSARDGLMRIDEHEVSD